MPGTTGDGPTVSLSFANNFWGKDDAGVTPMLDRMHNAKVTCDELKAFYSTRASIEDEYARKLLALCRKPLGSNETGTLRASLDSVRGETEAIGKTHSTIASQMKSELEEPLAAFAGGMKERRKIVQNGIEKLHKTKMHQTASVNKSRDRYEQDCLRIKGYLAQGHMVMGQEERKNKAKLEKTQIQLASNSSEYEGAVKVLEETTGRWNKEWKAACDKFQDLEEERLDFTKSSLWNYANIASTGCVSDDASCEKIRVSLESCEVEKDIKSFIDERGTGQEIPDPPKYINFCRGDINDTSSETSEEDNYSVAQFQRTINPAYRSSSPQPSTYESHHDPQSELAMKMGHNESASQSDREATVTPQKTRTQADPQDTQRVQQVPHNYDPSQHGDVPNVPHNEYPTDGMTMFCRTGPPSEKGSTVSINRPSSGDSRSELSNPTSMSSVEPPSGQRSPTKAANGASSPGVAQGKPQPQKKRSTFFSNSPFRRKSKHEKERQQSGASTSNRNTWSAPKQNSPAKPPPFEAQTGVPDDRRTGSPEPADPRANFQLNVGNNVFDVASPDATGKGPVSKGDNAENLDPIAQALADLKGSGKQASGRVSADRYHGIATPASESGASTSQQRGAPPPAYNSNGPPPKRLDAPQPAFTSAQMQDTTRKYTGQTQEMFNGPSRHGQRPSCGNQPVPRAVSPSPRRSASPQPSHGGGHRERQHSNAGTTPSSSYQSESMNGRYRQSPSGTPTKHAREASYSPQYSRHNSPNNTQGATPPRPQFRRPDRPGSASGMEVQLAGAQMDPYYGPPGGGYGGSSQRPSSMYQRPQDAGPGGQFRSRSRSIAGEDGRQLSRDGRPVLHFARAMYSYTAAIPEELGFNKGDVLAVLRHQDDGWWEAEVTGQPIPPGLVPSNYLARC